MKSQIRLGAALAGRRIDLNTAHAGHLSLKLNGKVMQDRTNNYGGFPLTRLLESCFVGITLESSGVVATETPAGIGFFCEPQVFLRPGDACALEIGRIGRLVNRVVADEYRFLKSFRSESPASLRISSGNTNPTCLPPNSASSALPPTN